MEVLRTAAGCELSELGDFGSGDVVLLRENGACANGWSNDEVTDVGSAGMVHGPWGNDATDVSLEVTIPEGLTKCEVSWRSWAIDSRDNEVDSLLIDGEEVWSVPINRPDQGCQEGWEEGPGDFPNPWGGAEDVCFDLVEVQVPCTGAMTLNFVSGIDQGESDESWGFSDVRVVGRPETEDEAARRVAIESANKRGESRTQLTRLARLC